MDPNFKLDEYIFHHVLNSYEYHILPFLPSIHLPHFLSLHGLMVILCALFLIILLCFMYDKKSRVPRGISNVIEVFVVFIRDEIAINSFGEEEGKKFTPLLCTFFFFILGMNLMGMLPIFSTATANVGVTFALATITFSFMTLGTIAKNGFINFIKALIPPVPFYLVPFMFVLEFLGLFIKAGALTIRLFANMLAGHIVILSLCGLVVLLGWVALPAVVLAILISLLEVMVVFLQAYIFTLLSALFIGQMYHPQH